MSHQIKLLQEVSYFNGNLWYQIKWDNKRKLVNNKNKLKSFIVVDVTKEKIYTRDEFIRDYFLNKEDVSAVDVLTALDNIKYKVFKKIRLKADSIVFGESK